MRSILLFAVVLVTVALVVPAPSRAGDARKMNVAIFLYEGVEILDFAGPSEVFAATRIGETSEAFMPFNVYTVAAAAGPLLSQRFITVVPQYTIDDCPKPDIIVFPGGNAGPSSRNPAVIAWAKSAAGDSAILMSVCTGAFILARAGLLDDREATTWYGAIDGLREAAPKATVHEGTRFVDNGEIVTTAGVSAGIDGALHLVSRLYGIDVARAVAKYMEYDKWEPGQGRVSGAGSAQ